MELAGLHGHFNGVRIIKSFVAAGDTCRPLDSRQEHGFKISNVIERKIERKNEDEREDGWIEEGRTLQQKKF